MSAFRCLPIQIHFEPTSFRTRGPDLIPPETYDYSALNSFALRSKPFAGNSKNNGSDTEHDMDSKGSSRRDTERTTRTGEAG